MYALDAREQQKKGGPLGGAGLPIEHYIKRHLDRAEGIKTGSIEDIISRQAEEDLARIAAEKKPPSAAEMTAEERAKFGIPDPTLDIERIKKLGEDFKKEAPAVLAGIGAGHLLPGIEALGPAVSLPVARDLHQRLIRLQSTLLGHDGLFEVVPSPYAVMKDVTFKALVECFDMVEKVAVAERKGVSAQKRRKKG